MISNNIINRYFRCANFSRTIPQQSFYISVQPQCHSSNATWRNSPPHLSTSALYLLFIGNIKYAYHILYSIHQVRVPNFNSWQPRWINHIVLLNRLWVRHFDIIYIPQECSTSRSLRFISIYNIRRVANKSTWLEI